MKRYWLSGALLAAFSQYSSAIPVSIASVNDWGQGFQGSGVVTNETQSKIDGWKVTFDAAFNIDQIWGAKVESHSGTQYTLVAEDWDKQIEVGKNVTFGFIASPGNGTMPTNAQLVVTGSSDSGGSSDNNSDDSSGDSSNNNDQTCTKEETVTTVTPVASDADVTFAVANNNTKYKITVKNKTNATLKAGAWTVGFDTPYTVASLNGKSTISAKSGNTYTITGGSSIKAGAELSFIVTFKTTVSDLPTNVTFNNVRVDGSTTITTTTTKEVTTTCDDSNNNSDDNSGDDSGDNSGDDSGDNSGDHSGDNSGDDSSDNSGDHSGTDSTAANSDDWLHASGNKLVDKDGKAVWLTGANWFGFNTADRVLHGLWSISMDSAIKSMADRGINVLRIPISTQLITEWMNNTYTSINVNTWANPELTGLNSLQVFDKMVADAKKYGVKIIIDVHSAEADNMGHLYATWYKGSITEQVYENAWVWIASRYKDDDTVIGFDLKNEPHGQANSDSLFAKWDNSTDANNWKNAAQTTATKILAVNPNALILVEGVETFPKDGVNWTSKSGSDYYFNWWGSNLRGVAKYPVTVAGHQDKIMYSPHDYGPSVYRQPWFYSGFSKDTLVADTWNDNWLYIHKNNISPLLIGEWGGFMDGGDNEKWMNALGSLITQYKLHHTFWCFNPDSSDTGGLVKDDWTTWDEAKYKILKPTLWQTSAGKFVSLDHQVALGSNGVSLSNYYQDGNLEPIGN